MFKFSSILAAMLLLAAPACDRYIDTEEPVRSLPETNPVPINLAVFLDDGTVTLRWELSDSSGVNRFRVYASDAEDGEYQLIDSTDQFSVTLDDLPLDQRKYFRVATVTTAGIESSRSESVTATPLHMTIAINGDNEYTNSRNIQVQINSSSAPSYVMISEQPDLADAEWDDYAFNKPFELSEGDGVKTVYVRLQYPDESVSGEPLVDDIILDTDAEITDLVFFATDTLEVGDEVTFRVTCGEPDGEAWVTFGSVRNFALNDDATEGDLTADDGIYGRTYTVPHGVTVHDAVVYGDFTDAAGNRAESFGSTELLNVNMPPAAVDLAADTTDSTLVLTWSLSDESDFASYRLYRGSSPLTEPGTDPFAIITNRNTTRYETTVPVGSPYYWLFVFDGHGEWARSNVVQRP